MPHEAVQFAVRELIRRPGGPASFFHAEELSEAVRLSRAVLAAPPHRQEGLLANLRDGKTVAHTLALAHVIPALKGQSQATAREFLTSRLDQNRPNHDNPEMRRMAAVSGIRKSDATAPLSLAASQAPLLIRGDITFLRQDFAVQLPVFQAAPDIPPIRFSFDFVVRKREVTQAERTVLRTAHGEQRDYPQREAVLFALRELTGKDAGPTTLAWQNLFPQAEEDVESARLCRKVVDANPIQQEALLERLRDDKGLANTLALARAIPGLKGSTQEKARQFLTERLVRMTASTLRDKLGDEEPEVRHAAVRACVRKAKKDMVPDLIALLDGDEPVTSRVAEAGLKELTGRDFSEPAQWRTWWQGEGGHGSASTE
jgi:hypothetical protein